MVDHRPRDPAAPAQPGGAATRRTAPHARAHHPPPRRHTATQTATQTATHAGTPPPTPPSAGLPFGDGGP
eukprot:878240-Prymnesium_polylepis.1